MSFKLDTREFKAAIEFVVKATKKDAADVVNKAALTVIIGGKGVKGAIQRTPKASIAEINRESAAVLYSTIRDNRGKHMSPEQIGIQTKAILARRRAARGYTAGPGWHEAAVALGGRGVKISERFDRSEARKGNAVKARSYSATAYITNTAPAIEDIGVRPLQDAIDDTARDMMEYANKKLAETFKKVQA